MRVTGIMVILVLALPGRFSGESGIARASEESGDGFDDWEQRAASVNEGELRILDTAARQREHHHHTRVAINERSLETGWVELNQCHWQLDPVPALQIVYSQGRVRALRVEKSRNIGVVRIEGETIELEDVQPGSSLCVRLYSKALHRENGGYVLRNGPFMRRFLDGYYPMRITMQVSYPANLLHYAGAGPAEIANRVQNRAGRLGLEVRFEGRLTTEFRFAPQ